MVNVNVSFITGLMGSGKSKELIKEWRKDSNSVCFSASIDQETSSQGLIESRNGEWIPSINLWMNDDPEKIYSFIKTIISALRIESIYIDESQFLSTVVVKKIIDIAQTYNISVFFYGLSLTFTGEYFESSEYLCKTINIDNFTYLPSFCEAEECRKMALYNGRLVSGKVIREGETFLEEKSSYSSLCSEHYFL